MIKARNIIKSYQNGESRFQVLKDISLDIEDNDFVVILGASGCCAFRCPTLGPFRPSRSVHP